MELMINVNWHKSQNFGDQLTPYILKKIWDLDSKHIGENSRDTPHIMPLGSILNEANENTTVLGAGIVSNTLEFSSKAKYISVRGNLTLGRIKEMGVDVSNIHVGDPAIILPKIYTPPIKRKYSFTIVPHWIDYGKAMHYFPHYTIIILIIRVIT
jgi:pyruvyltransferase